jgi:hypothetical protein
MVQFGRIDALRANIGNQDITTFSPLTKSRQCTRHTPPGNQHRNRRIFTEATSSQDIRDTSPDAIYYTATTDNFSTQPDYWIELERIHRTITIL